MLTYNDVQGFIEEGLTALGYSNVMPNTDPTVQRMPRFDPGPPGAGGGELQRKSPGAVVFITVGGGNGLQNEQLYELKNIVVRVLGHVKNYNDAEKIANDIDKILLAVAGNGMLGATHVLYVSRTSGSPQLIDYDAADRYHFQATYVAKAQTGLVQ